MLPATVVVPLAGLLSAMEKGCRYQSAISVRSPTITWDLSSYHTKKTSEYIPNSHPLFCKVNFADLKKTTLLDVWSVVHKDKWSFKLEIEFFPSWCREHQWWFIFFTSLFFSFKLLQHNVLQRFLLTESHILICLDYNTGEQPTLETAVHYIWNLIGTDFVSYYKNKKK